MRNLLGSANPNWKGGLIAKSCLVCGGNFEVRRVHSGARYCSMQCVGVSQRGRRLPVRSETTKQCAVCSSLFTAAKSVATKQRTCSQPCARKLRSRLTAGKNNPNWCGGLSGQPYRWNWYVISRKIKTRDEFFCQGPNCPGRDSRLTAHHIDYIKMNCDPSNLITLCSSCNTVANFNRPFWQKFYSKVMASRGMGIWNLEPI